MLSEVWDYLQTNQDQFWLMMRTHLALSGGALSLGMAIGVPVGLLAAYRPQIGRWPLGVINGLRVVPSLAILFLALPYLGTGFLPALVALSILATPPVVLNTYAGFRGVDHAVIEAAYGTGMSPPQVLWRIATPLALPIVLAGIRTAAVEVVASASLASFIGGGGLGDFVQRGYNLFDVRIMLAGAIPIALLALLAEVTLGILERGVRRATT